MSNDTDIASLQHRIDELNQQAWEARVNDSERAFELSQQSVRLAREANYARGLAEGLRSLGFGYVRLYKNDEAAPLLRESLSLFQSINDLKGQAVALEYLGIVERNWGNLGLSLELLLKGHALIRQVDSPEVEITSCYQIGVTYKHLGNHENALDYLYQAISIAGKINFPLMEGYAINIIGSIYFDNGDYEKALDCYQRSLAIRRQFHDKWGEAGSLDNIGFTYLKLNNIDKAIEHCKQSLAICQSTDDKKGEANTLLHLAEIYEHAEDVKNAFEFSNKSLEIRKARGDRRGEAEVLLFLAELTKHRGGVDDDQILDWLSGALKLAEKIKAQDLLSKAYYNLHEHYSEKGDFKKSVAHLEAHLKIEKELHKNTINQKIYNLEISHKAEAISQRNKELIELNDEIAKANAELKIESSLERVRTAAMAMNEPADMLEVCRIISHELGVLNMKEIRNVQTAIFYEHKGSYMNYEYYAKHDKLIVTDVDYNNHPVAEKFANQMLQGANQVWTHSFKGQEVRDWLNYQRTTNVFIDHYLETADTLNYYWYSLGPVALGMSTYAPLNETEIDLFKRFRNVFELAYRRYMDIEKANAQAREAQIEAALERVRAASMAMHHSDDLISVINVVKEQLIQLGFHFHGANFVTDYSDKGYTMWLAAPNESFPTKIYVPQLQQKLFKGVADAAEKGQDFTTYTLSFEEKNLYFKNLFENSLAGNTSEEGKKLIFESKGMAASVVLLSKIRLNLMNVDLIPYTEEENSILKRIAYVFEQSYIRFLDLQKAEAQAREAQIETALERIRARAMAMHTSDELIEVANILREQMGLLGQPELETSVVNLYNAESGLIHNWNAFRQPGLSSGAIKTSTSSFSANSSELTKEMIASYQSGKKEFTLNATGSKLMEFLEVLIKADPQVANYTGRYVPEQVFYHFTSFTGGTLLTVSYQPPSEETKLLQRRAASVFDMAYRRYLDLKKAEAQTKEAQIELALERVRAKAMAMQDPKEFVDVINVIGEQFIHLDFDIEWVNFGANGLDIADGIDTWNFAIIPGGETVSSRLFIPRFDHRLFTDAAEQLDRYRKTGNDLFVIAYDKKDKDHWLDHLFAKTIFKDVPVEYRAMQYAKPGYTTSNLALKDTFLSIGKFDTRSFTDEQHAILRRFGNAFGQAYTRFQDLQKAEAQAREAQIETGLERVRSKTMAMHKSEEVTGIAVSLNEELLKLGFEGGSTIIIIDEKTGDTEQWTGFSADKSLKSCYVPYFKHPCHDAVLDAWKKGERYLVYTVSGDEKRALDEHYFATGYKIFPASDKKWMREMKSVTFSHAFMKYGAIHWGPGHLTEEQIRILQRFAKVFEQSYTRFLDLQRAETQTQKAKIETALEKVRARALAMQQPEELIEVAKVLRQEMGLLGVEELETCSIYIHDEAIQRTECWFALKDIRSEEKKLVSDHFALNLEDTWVGRAMLKFYQSDAKQTSIVMQGVNRKEWINYCEERSVPFRGYYGEVIPDRTYHLYKFSHGAIGAASAGDISNESWDLLQRASSVFSLAYSRFKDLTQARTDLIKLKEEKRRAEDALSELQSTQKQLIQSEKMASLGELTAGIAHEIQNPLNFVNNFSDVSHELLEEMKTELATGNTQSAIEIINNVKDNLEKILHHGKRADAIVKSMLQHSRSSSGKKEPTDINSLTEEYLRLAFHGLRAKDKSFNAKFETHLDDDIGNINIIPQDIGRVILNLINNAFYAVNERKAKSSNGYEPIVLITTKKINDKVEVKVKDNGGGIPPKVLDKIFQPFFTTKPTGQGTGLGLSLSYDIVTKGHGGDIKVETKEGEGSEFIISLPMNN